MARESYLYDQSRKHDFAVIYKYILGMSLKGRDGFLNLKKFKYAQSVRFLNL